MEEISLRELIEVLIKRKKIIMGVTAFAVVAAIIVSLFVLKPQYEAKMVLITSDPGQQLKEGVGNGNGNIENILDAVSQYPSMNLETYRHQVKTPEVIAKTIEDLELEDEYTVESLSDRIDLATVNGTELITIKMRDKDPKKAADIINKIGQNFISVVSTNTKERVSKISENIKAQMGVEKKKYDDALMELKEILSQPRGADELALELNAKLEQITGFKTRINELDIRKDELQSGLKVAEKEPGRGNSLVIGSKNVILDDSNKILKIELAEIKTSIESVQNKIGQIQKDIEVLQTEHQDKRHKESIIQQKVNISQNTYESFVKKYEELKVTELSKIGEASITVISDAYPANRPVAPRKSLNVAISLVLGLMISVFLVFFQEYWESAKQQN